MDKMESAQNSRDLQPELQNTEMRVRQTVSAFMDGESAAPEDGSLVGQAFRDNWRLYHVITETIQHSRAPDPVTTAFTARLSAALENEPAHGAQPEQSSTGQHTGVRKPGLWPRIWPGLAMTAAVASVLWVAQPMLTGDRADVGMAFVQSQPAQLIGANEVEPQAEYVSAHRQIAAPIAVRQVALMPGVD